MNRRHAGMILVVSLAAASCGGDPSESENVPVEQPIVIAGHEVHVFEEYGVNEHVEGEVTYRQTPPVVGPHSVIPAPCGVHNREIPNENMVHTLEHGVVGILFDPNFDRTEIRRIERFVKETTERTFSAPFSGLDQDIAVVGWGRMMNLATFEEDAVEEFVQRFAGDAPEDVGCSDFVKNSYLRA